MGFVGSKISLEGDSALLVRFQHLNKAVSLAVLEESCIRATEPMLAEAKRRVQVGSRTGKGHEVRNKKGRVLFTVSVQRPHLRDALTVSHKHWTNRLKAQAGITRTQKFAYANPLEWGARPHEIKTPWPIPGGPRRIIHHPGHRPYPFLRPAYVLNWRAGVEVIREEVKQYVLAAWTGAGGNAVEKYDDKKGI